MDTLESSKAFKVVLVGHGYTGKTSIVRKYTDGEFSERYTATIGHDYTTKSITRNKTTYDLNLWTLSGQDCDVTTVPPINFRYAAAVVIVFSIVDDKSMQMIEMWKEKALETVNEDIPFILVANKCDMKRIPPKDLSSIAEQSGFDIFFQTSAKTGEGVNQLFEDITDAVITYNQNRQRSGSRIKPLKLNSKKKQKSNSICPFF